MPTNLGPEPHRRSPPVPLTRDVEAYNALDVSRFMADSDINHTRIARVALRAACYGTRSSVGGTAVTNTRLELLARLEATKAACDWLAANIEEV